MTSGDYFDYWAEQTWRVRGEIVLLFAVVAVILMSLGPFNSFDDPPLFRFAYWFGVQCIFGLLFVPPLTRLLRRLPAVTNFPLPLGFILFTTTMTIPTALFVYLLDFGVLQLALNAGYQFEAEELSSWQMQVTPFTLMQLYWSVLVIAIISIGFGSVPFFWHSRHPRSALPLNPGVQFFSRLPDHMGTALICLQMEDHYLRVVTKSGEALILLRFRDALNELEGYPGVQVHRSWWVASGEIERMSRNGRKTELVMTNGTRVPVSASYRSGIDALLAGRMPE